MFVIEIRIIISHGPSKNPSYHITGACIGRQLSIGNGEADGADMIGNNPEGDCLPAVAEWDRIFYLVIFSVASIVPVNTSVS